MTNQRERKIVIFDGVCNFCNGAVNFIIRHDPDGLFAFAPMQSAVGQQLIRESGATMVGIDTFLLVKGSVCYERTDAALEITKDLTGYWHLLNAFRIVPRPIRDYFYSLFARNRYALFGRRDSCMVPTSKFRYRFIEWAPEAESE